MERLEIRRFEQADEVRAFEHGTFEFVRLGGMTVGRAVVRAGMEVVVARRHRPGRPLPGRARRASVVSGRAVALMDDGTEVVMEPGDLFAIPPGHDSWVVGDEPYVSLHFLGAEHYAGE